MSMTINFKPEEYLTKAIDNLVSSSYKYTGMSTRAVNILKKGILNEYLHEYYKITTMEEIQAIDVKVSKAVSEVFTVSSISNVRSPLPDIYRQPNIHPLTNPQPYILTGTTLPARYDSLDVTYSSN